MEDYKKHIFQVGVCALITGTLSLLMFINSGNTLFMAIILGAFCISTTIFYIIGKIKIHDASNFEITKEKLLYLGFEAIPHKTIGNTMVKDLGRGRLLSLSNVGNPNEFLFISSRDNWAEEPSYINQLQNDVVTLHNYDYDGYITFNKLESLCKLLSDPKDYGLSYNGSK
jgi:hypothetical protein